MRITVRFLLVLWLVACHTAVATMVVDAPTFSAVFDRGALTKLRGPRGDVMAMPGETVRGAGVLLVDAVHWAAASTVEPRNDGVSGWTEVCAFDDAFDGGRLTMNYALDEASGDLLISQEATAPAGGISAVRWSIEKIPLSWRLIVPGFSGIRMTADTPGDFLAIDYPMSWEAQLLIVEGDEGGFYVWADDSDGRFKRLVIEREPDGWRVSFDTHPPAPYEEQTACASVTWRLNVYEGDWRVPARRYREWAETHFAPTPTTEQQPDWVGGIGACVIIPPHAPLLEPIARQIDPTRTLLYIYGWRADGYDRNYPDYENVYPHFPPFMEAAKALGFRVMLHVNYFGCDPLHPLYEQFEPYHCRLPHGQNDLDWWHYPCDERPIKFAYINPASDAWRREVVARFTHLCETYDVDALHLDQTLVIYNDYNGLIDGKTMLEGNIALHRELREALPQVALSGEGLNEVTYRHEAFAQLHVYGIDHADHTFNAPMLDMAHPISAYLLRPYTHTYGYLGMSPPENTRLYTAWLEAYRRWGVIPTLKVGAKSVEEPDGFTQLLFDEMRFWQTHNVQPDMDGDWPSHVAFPLRTDDGSRVTYTRDGALTLAGEEVQRIIRDVQRVELPGTIPGWQAYTESHIIGLDPDERYPYRATPRDMDALRVTVLPPQYTLAGVISDEQLAMVRTRPVTGTDIRLASLLPDAVTGSRPASGEGYEQAGPLSGPDGAMFEAHGDALHAHPPWQTPGSGEAYARFTLKLPDTAQRFVSGVALNPFSVGDGRSDGVGFGISVTANDIEKQADTFTKSEERTTLEVDLRPFAGKETTLELWVDPGPEGNPSHDWARWHDPRIICKAETRATIGLAGLDGWRWAVTADTTLHLSNEDDSVSLAAAFPGTNYLLREKSAAVTLPVSLETQAHTVVYEISGRITRGAPRHARVDRVVNTVGGVAKPGYFTHPPDQGATEMHFPLTLNATPAVFSGYVGLRDGTDQSSGVVFRVTVNGVEAAREHVLPGQWHEIAADLSAWAEQTVVIALIADADGDYICDWACWGIPAIRAKEG